MCHECREHSQWYPLDELFRQVCPVTPPPRLMRRLRRLPHRPRRFSRSLGWVAVVAVLALGMLWGEWIWRRSPVQRWLADLPKAITGWIAPQHTQPQPPDETSPHLLAFFQK